MSDFVLPQNVKVDVDNGFFVTDADDGWQRCKRISDTVFVFKCDVNGLTVEEEIDIDNIDKEDAISGFYDSVSEVEDIYGDDANMIIAECEFENSCMAELPRAACA
jgi:hypothetical protein